MNVKLYFYYILVVNFSTLFLKGNDAQTSCYLKQAEEAHVQNHIKEAALKSQEALDSIAENSSITQAQRAAVIKDFTTYSIAYAKLLANERHFEEARKQLYLILLPEADPTNPDALHLLNYLQAFHDDPQEKAPLLFQHNINKNEDDAHNTTRANLLSDVEKDWITQVPQSSEHLALTEANLSPADTISKKLHNILLPKVELEDTTLDESVDYLKEKSREADLTREGVNIVIKSAFIESLNNTNSPHFNLELHEVPLGVALNYLAQQANCKVEIDPYAVSLVPASQLTEKLSTREYEVSSSFFPNQETSFPSIKNFFQSKGIEFPIESSATYLPSTNKLIVRNTPERLDLIDTLIKSVIKSPPLQVSIETKFIEINQNDLSELGFNWLLGAFSLGNSGLSMSGGGSANGLNTTAYPFPTAGMNPIGALRSGHQAINDTSVDTVLEGNARNALADSSVPGIFSIGGVCSTPQFQMVVRALNQKKGIDLMAAPHVTTKNGSKAMIKIVDEFIYPSQYSPPQIPVSTVATNSYTGGLRSTPPTITPSFPTSWTSKNLGVTLEAKPTITPDHKMISLELHPQITDFDGFINYGTPINTVGYSVTATNMSGTPFSETLTTNTINQPVFTIREVNTAVTVKDGQTVIIGGLIREDIQHVEDKIPILGDIPLAGFLFRSKTERKLKKNLIIFVTPKILNADGVPIGSKADLSPTKKKG